MNKTNLKKIGFLVCFWIFCTIFIVLYDSSILGFQSEIEGGEYNFFGALGIAVLFTTIGASFLSSIDVLILSRRLRKLTFGLSILTRSIIYLSFIVVFISLVRISLISSELNRPMFSSEVMFLYSDFITSTRIIMIIIYWGIACSAAIFVLMVSEKFGQGVLVNFILGRYHKPKEEKRIFMFMDLKSSTTYAEQLGHIRYSSLIQDCFYDLTDVVLKYNAFIYQYVGDEVVLSWNLKKGLENANCINLYLQYDSVIQDRKEFYQKKYGIIPEFKAGVDSGHATVVEVGQIKKELAYHGDVLNTASRIQGKCNDFKARLLISEKLWKSLAPAYQKDFELIGNISLKGKETPVNIYKYIT